MTVGPVTRTAAPLKNSKILFPLSGMGNIKDQTIQLRGLDGIILKPTP